MCNPAAVFMLSAASTGVGLMAQSQAARAQAQRQEQMSDLARQKRELQLSGENLVAQQQSRRSGLQAQKAEEASLVSEGKIMATAATRGVEGAGIAMTLDDVNSQYLAYREALDVEDKFRQEGRALGDVNSALYAKSELMNINQDIKQPNYMKGLLDVGSAYAEMKMDEV
jgi:uncharacterized protein YlxW (UPF0749 family)